MTTMSLKPRLGKMTGLALPIAIAALAATAAYAGADTTFTPALTKFTDFLEGCRICCSSGAAANPFSGHLSKMKPATIMSRSAASRVRASRCSCRKCVPHFAALARRLS